MTRLRPLPADLAKTDTSNTWAGTQDFTAATVLGVSGGSGGTASGATTTAPGVVQLAGDLAGTYTAPTVPALTGKADKSALAPVATSGAYADLSGAPALAPVATSGAYTDLTGRPALAPVATSGAYTDLTGRPALAAVATTGAYADLSGKPTIPPAPTKPIVYDAGGGVFYWITAEGVVTVMVQGAAGGAPPVTFATLPAGYRPATSWTVPMVDVYGGTTWEAGTLIVSTSGAITQDGNNRTNRTLYASFSFVAA